MAIDTFSYLVGAGVGIVATLIIPPIVNVAVNRIWDHFGWPR